MGSTKKVVGGLLSYFVSKQVVEFFQRIINTRPLSEDLL